MYTHTCHSLEQWNCDAIPSTGRACDQAMPWRYLAKTLLGYWHCTKCCRKTTRGITTLDMPM
jgi:hypothetical protein